MSWARAVVELALGLQQPDLQHLARVVPFVHGGVDVEALVALQPDEPCVERGGEDLGQLGLAHAGLTFEQQRPTQPQAEEDGGDERPIGHVVALAEGRLQAVDGIGMVGHTPTLARLGFVIVHRARTAIQRGR